MKLKLIVQEMEDKVLSTIQTQMIPFSTANELKYRNVYLFDFGQNHSILPLSHEFPSMPDIS